MRVFLVSLVILLGSVVTAQQKELPPNILISYNIGYGSPQIATTRAKLKDEGAQGTVSPADGTVYGIIFHPSFPEGVVGGDPAEYGPITGQTRPWTIKWSMAPTGSGLVLRVRTHQTPHASHDETLFIADPPPAAAVPRAGDLLQKLATSGVDLDALFKPSVPRGVGVEIERFFRNTNSERGENLWIANGRVTQGGRPVLGYMIRQCDSRFIAGRCRKQGPVWEFEFKDLEPGKHHLIVESTCGFGFDSRIVTIQ
jgi:hypothetical protein